MLMLLVNVDDLLLQERRRHTTINQTEFLLFALHFLFIYFLRCGIIRSQCMYSSSALLRCGFSELADPGILKTTCMAGFTSKHYKPAPYI